MLKSDIVVPEEQHFILSTLSPSRAQRRMAVVVVLVIVAVFLLIAAGPLRGVHIGRIDAFVPAYATAMFVCDSITAILLYSQFSIARSRASFSSRTVPGSRSTACRAVAFNRACMPTRTLSRALIVAKSRMF